jgi:hypothetical protein
MLKSKSCSDPRLCNYLVLDILKKLQNDLLIFFEKIMSHGEKMLMDFQNIPIFTVET